MMNILFLMFYPTEISNMPLNWTSTILGILVIPISLWLIPSRNNMAMNILFIKLHNEKKQF